MNIAGRRFQGIQGRSMPSQRDAESTCARILLLNSLEFSAGRRLWLCKIKSVATGAKIPDSCASSSINLNGPAKRVCAAQGDALTQFPAPDCCIVPAPKRLCSFIVHPYNQAVLTKSWRAPFRPMNGRVPLVAGTRADCYPFSGFRYVMHFAD